MKIGVLALQGDFSKHLEVLARLSVDAISVKTAEHLAICDGLIIPGGESTTLSLLLRKHGLSADLKKFGQQKAVFGTCAGSILISQESHDPRVDNYQFLDITISRNAYGRQTESFIAPLNLEIEQNSLTSPAFEAYFIRAPKITQMGAQVKVLARYQGDPVLVQSGKILAATFHPELTADNRIHQYFINSVRSFI